MRFYWTAEDVGELLERIAPFEKEDFVAEHRAALRTHLRKLDEVRPGIRREQEWKQVEAQARRLESWLAAQPGDTGL